MLLNASIERRRPGVRRTGFRRPLSVRRPDDPPGNARPLCVRLRGPLAARHAPAEPHHRRRPRPSAPWTRRQLPPIAGQKSMNSVAPAGRRPNKAVRTGLHSRRGSGSVPRRLPAPALTQTRTHRQPPTESATDDPQLLERLQLHGGARAARCPSGATHSHTLTAASSGVPVPAIVPGAAARHERRASRGRPSLAAGAAPSTGCRQPVPALTAAAAAAAAPGGHGRPPRLTP